MKKFLRHSLLASAVTVAGIATTAAGAFAQAAPTDATVNFTGTVGSVCLFSNVTDGVLEDMNGFLAANEFDGTRGSVDVSCTGNADITVSAPIDNGSTSDLLGAGSTYDAVVRLASDTTATGPSASNGSFGPSAASLGLGAPVDETLSVDLMIDPTAPIPAGAYNYNVVVTATPL